MRGLATDRRTPYCTTLAADSILQLIGGALAGLRDFAEVNPFTIIVDAMRHLWLGAPAHNSVWGAAVWSLVIVAVFAPLAVSRYRRAAGR